MRNISGTEMLYKQERCGSTISTSLYFYFSFIEKIISSSDNRSLDNTFARSPERAEFFEWLKWFLIHIWAPDCHRSNTAQYTITKYLYEYLRIPKIKIVDNTWLERKFLPQYKKKVLLKLIFFSYLTIWSILVIDRSLRRIDENWCLI